MRNFWKSLVADLQKSNLSSWKRIIKFLGLAIIPILYGITCILAFWNPIDNFDRASIGILDEDSPVGIVIYTQTTNSSDSNELTALPTQTYIKIATDKDGNALSTADFRSIYSAAAFTGYQSQNLYFSDNTSVSLTYKSDGDGTEFVNGNITYKILSYSYSTFARMLLESGLVFSTEKKGDDIFSTVYGISVNSSDKILNFHNIRYLSGDNAKNNYHSNNYNIQLHFDSNFTYNTITSLSSIFAKLNSLNVLGGLVGIKDLISAFDGINVYSSFSQNFIFGIFITTIKNFDYAIFANIFTKLSEEVLSNPEFTVILDQISPNAQKNLASITKILTFNTIDVVAEANKNITIYGLGLGQMFLLIGLTAGAIATTFVIDKSKRIRKANGFQWFLAKYTHLVIIGVISAVLLTTTVFACGWCVLGIVKYMELVAWFIFFEIILNAVICSLWFTFRSEALGRWLAILYTLLNIVVGWGSFPSFMMPKLSDILSYITIYRWSNLTTLHIIYASYSFATTVFINMGFLILIAVVFLSIGLLTSTLRFKDIHYGSYKGKFVCKGLEVLNVDTTNFYLTKVERRLYLWERRKNHILNDHKHKEIISDLEKEIAYLQSLEAIGNQERLQKHLNKLLQKVAQLQTLRNSEANILESKKIKKLDIKIQNIKHRQTTKKVYNWKFLADQDDLDLILLNKATNKISNPEKGFAFYEKKIDKSVHLPNQSDNELVSRND